MRAWMLPWLFPVALLMTVATATLAESVAGTFVAVVWGWVLFPAVVFCVRGHARASRDTDTDYWRITRR